MIKKIFSLFAAILFAGSMMAADPVSVTINFGTSTGYWAAHTNATYTDSDSRTWTRTCSVTNMSGQAAYSQFGNASNTPDVELYATAGSDITVSAFSVKMNGASGGSSPTTGTIYLYKRPIEGADVQLATAAVSGTNTVECKITSEVSFASTDKLVVAYDGTIKAVRVTELKYTYTVTPTDPTVVATPTFSPAAGTYASAQNVTISCTTEDATIHYTIDGTEPTTSSPAYSSAIAVSTTTTIKAIAVKSGLDNSAVATAAYTILPVEHAGTESDPYTVADARNAIAVGGDLSNKYVAGIISQVDSYSEQYSSITYWISDDGETTSPQLEVYSGKGLNGADFSSLNDLQVADEVTVKGTLKLFGETYEFDKNSQLVSFNRPGGATLCATPTFSPAAGTYTSAQEVTISCETAGATIYYTTDGTTPTNESSVYSAAINVGEDMTIKAIAMKEGMENSFVATAAYVINIEDQSVKKTWDLSIDETASASEDELTWTATYVDMSFAKGTSSTAANNYYPGTSGQSYTSTRAYKNAVITITPKGGKQITTAVFTATTSGYATTLKNAAWTNATAVANDVTITVTASGSGAISAKLGGTTGFTSVTVNYEDIPSTPTISATPSSLDLGSIYKSSNREDAKKTFTLTGSNLTNQVKLLSSGDAVDFDRSEFVDPTDGAINIEVGVYPYSTDEEGEFTAIISVKGTGENPDGIDKEIVTVTWKVVPAPEPTGQFELYAGAIIPGRYLITYNNGAMNTTVTSNRLQYAEITPVDKVVINPDASLVWTLAQSGEYWTLYNEEAKAYAAATGSKNQAQMLTDGTDDKAKWTITVSEGVYEFENKARAAAASDPGNKWLRRNGDNGFAAYSSSTGGALTLYRRTGWATSVDNTELSNKAVKFIQNGQLFIELNGRIYNVQGQTVK